MPCLILMIARPLFQEQAQDDLQDQEADQVETAQGWLKRLGGASRDLLMNLSHYTYLHYNTKIFSLRQIFSAIFGYAMYI